MQREALTGKLGEVSDLLSESGFPYGISYYRFDELELLKKNARFMRNDTFRQLVSNIRRDGGLGSVPLLYAGPDAPGTPNRDKPEILSGNHRVMAGREAGIDGCLCYVIKEYKTPQERTAIALSYNAITGQDDMQILKEMYDSIEDLDLKAFAGIDEEVRQQLSKIKFEPVSEPRLVFKEVSILFLPREVDEIRAALEEVDRKLDLDTTYVAQKRDYSEFFELLATAKDKLNIRNNAAAMLEIIRRGLKQINAERRGSEVESVDGSA